jgi:hypothetical protein
MMTRLLAPRGAVICGATLGLIAAIPQEKMAGIRRPPCAMTRRDCANDDGRGCPRPSNVDAVGSSRG